MLPSYDEKPVKYILIILAKGTAFNGNRVHSMDRSDVINLISESRTQDDYGRWIATKTSKQVMCQVDSVTRAEFFEGGRNGLNPEFKFTMFFGDYSGESVVEYQGKTYAVYRTYLRRTDIIELYVERKGGTNT